MDTNLYQTGEILCSLRKQMNLDMPSMAVILDIPYETYRNYEYGRRAAPEFVIERAKQAAVADRLLMVKIGRQIDAAVAAAYPGGIPSE